LERSFQSVDDGGPAGTRERILAAASDLFATSGFAGTSVAALRQRSGASASSIYHEFGSKEGVLAAVLQESAARWLAQAKDSAQRALSDSRRSGEPPLAAYFANLAEELTERPDFLRLLLLLSLERREAGEATIRAVRRVRARATLGLALGMRAGGLFGPEVPDDIADEIARVTLAFADGAFVAAQIDPETVDLRRMFAIFYAGLAAALRVEGAALAATGGQR
jgi:AcrR family transcriptional regulator